MPMTQALKLTSLAITGQGGKRATRVTVECLTLFLYDLCLVSLRQKETLANECCLVVTARLPLCCVSVSFRLMGRGDR